MDLPLRLAARLSKPGSTHLFCTTLPYWRNPNLKPVGKGFGFLIFIEQIGELQKHSSETKEARQGGNHASPPGRFLFSQTTSI